MNVLFDLNHPAHVHLFKNFIKYLNSKSHNVTVVSRDKDVTNDLLKYYQIPYTSLSKSVGGLGNLLLEMFERDYKILALHKKKHFDVSFGTSVSIAHLTLLSGVRSYNFNEDDDKTVKYYSYLTYPFSTKIVNPRTIIPNHWKNKRVFHDSLHELAYLHPNNFKPDEKVLDKYGLVPQGYFLVRNSALKAHHDKGAVGIDKSLWEKVASLLSAHPIIMSRESVNGSAIDPWDMHSIIAFSKMLISDSQTMTIEAAVLGVPALRFSSFVGSTSVIEELENEYELTYGFKPHQEKEFLSKIEELLSKPDLKEVWAEKRNCMLENKIDLNKWIIEYFENSIENNLYETAR